MFILKVPNKGMTKDQKQWILNEMINDYPGFEPDAFYIRVGHSYAAPFWPITVFDGCLNQHGCRAELLVD